MPITVNLPSGFKSITNNRSKIIIPDTNTLIEALLKLCLEYPELQSLIFNSELNNTQSLNVYLRISINDSFVMDLDAKIAKNCNIDIISAIAGG